jgi:L-lysine exporter family protein LysE/ArgO
MAGVTQALLTAAAGLGTGLSLIVAIGAQNAYVLRQGVRREHVGIIVAICAASDAALIAAGVGGLGAVVTTFPAVLVAITWGGAAFLVAYGLLAARRALRPAQLTAAEGPEKPLAAAVLTCLALTWLNPHVYLDTVLFLGSVGNTYDEGRWYFALGAALGSVLWFSGLGFGARGLGRILARPHAWQVLDGIIAATMLTLGVTMAARG